MTTKPLPAPLSTFDTPDRELASLFAKIECLVCYNKNIEEERKNAEDPVATTTTTPKVLQATHFIESSFLKTFVTDIISIARQHIYHSESLLISVVEDSAYEREVREATV